MWGNYMMNGAWWGMGLYMGIFWLLVLAAFAVLVMAIARRENPGQTEAPARKSARAILEERYARGEIDRREFEQKKQDLQR